MTEDELYQALNGFERTQQWKALEKLFTIKQNSLILEMLSCNINEIESKRVAIKELKGIKNLIFDFVSEHKERMK